MVAGIDEETPATAAAVRTSPCRHCGRGDAAPCRPRCFLSLPPSPPGPLAAQQQTAQPQPRRDSHAATCTPRAARALSWPGQNPSAPERATPPHLAQTVPRAPRSIAAPLHRPTASSHDRGCPLHRVHRAPPGRYKRPPCSTVSPHRSPLPSPHSPLSRAPLGSPGQGSKASGRRGLLEPAVPEVDDDRGQATAPIPFTPHCLPSLPLVPLSHPRPFSLWFVPRSAADCSPELERGRGGEVARRRRSEPRQQAPFVPRSSPRRRRRSAPSSRPPEPPR